MTPGARLAVADVRKRFGRLEVLRGVTFQARPGRVTAIVGPNAAGKTTLIKAVLGLVRLPPGHGTITIDGESVEAGERYRSRIGYMPQAARFPEHLTPAEILTMLRELRPADTPVDLGLIERLGLEPALHRRVGTLSGGTRQKLSAVVAFLFGPALAILDEPTAGLDPVASGVFKDRLAEEASRGTTVLLTSHILAEVEELADDVVFLVDGRVTFHGTVAELLDRAAETRLERAVAVLMERSA